METREKRATDKEQLRREILDAARDLFVNEGYENFSMQKLAKNTEHSSSTICLYFKNKDDLLFALCEEVAGRLFADLSNIRTAQSDPLESLRQALLYLIEFGFNNPDEYKVLFITRPQVYGTFDEFMEHESMARNSYFVFREIVGICMETGKLLEIDIDVLTQVLTVATRGAALSVNKTSFPWIDRNVLAHTLAEGLLRGYRRLFSLP
ncbi:MAG TPA: TetR/AcrR family transcriptional regulator [Nitrospirota bacterium]